MEIKATGLWGIKVLQKGLLEVCAAAIHNQKFGDNLLLFPVTAQPNFALYKNHPVENIFFCILCFNY